MESLVDAGGPNEHRRVVRTGPEDPGLAVYPSLGRCWLMVFASAGMAAFPLWAAAGGDPAHMPPDPLDRLWPLGAGLFESRPTTRWSDWVARNRRWVRTYELIEITYRARFGPRLRLRDSAGHRAMIKIESLQSDREVWDLVYNGILHSVIAGGARTDRQLHLVLHLPYPCPDIGRKCRGQM